jgi:hypothetical protein
VRCFGAGPDALADLYRTADLALNVTGAQEIRAEHDRLDRIAYVQSDPFGLQVDLEQGHRWARDQMARHCVHFTFGELTGTPASCAPTGGITWHPTRQPVAMELWPAAPPGARFTTITTWRNDTKHKVWNGETYYWTKHREFLAVADLPRHTSATLELAIDVDPAEAPLLAASGWHLTRRSELAVDVAAYARYITASRGEFTTARDQFVRPRTGWFSDRSATYLAAGRPVVTQDTGFGDVLPTGEGLFAFETVDDAAAALDEIECDPVRHGRSARALAGEYFAAERVLDDLIARVPG